MQTFKKNNITTIIILLILPISFISIYTIKQYLSRATDEDQISLETYCQDGFYKIPGEPACSRAPLCGGKSYDEGCAIPQANPQTCMGDGAGNRTGCKGYVPLCCYELARTGDPLKCCGYWERAWCYPEQCAKIDPQKAIACNGGNGGNCLCGHAVGPPDGWCHDADAMQPLIPLEQRLGIAPLTTATPTPIQTDCPEKFDYVATVSTQIKTYCDTHNQNCLALNKNYPTTLNCHGQVGPTPSVPVWGPYGATCIAPSCECDCIASSTPYPLTPTPSSSPTPTSNLIDVKINLKLKFQGISSLPKTNNMKVKIKLTNTDYQIGDFTANNNGIWTGTVTFTKIIKSNNYSIFIKGPKHLQKKFTNPLASGENNLDFTNTLLMSGDLADQDGIINSYDTSLIRNYLGKTDASSIRIADINLDSIVDSQDFSLLITTLGTLKYNQDED